MAQTYSEFLLANGATADEVKILDVPSARKAYDAMQTAMATADAAKKKAEEKYAANVKWAETVETQNQGYLKERDSAILAATAADAKLKKAAEMGLIELAEQHGQDSDDKDKDKGKGGGDNFDASKYVDRDTLMQVADREGEAIALVGDITAEHFSLFGNDPTKRLNFRDMRREATTRKVSVEQVWMERHGVQAARDAKIAADKAAYEKKVGDEAVTNYKSEHGNPLTAPLMISNTPFTGKVLSSGTDGKHPWQRSDAEKENARLTKALDSLAKQQVM